MANKLSENHIATFARAANDGTTNWPLHLAPESLQEATIQADKAYWSWVDATDAEEDAKMNLPIVQGIWNKSAEDAVRAGKKLPSKEDLETATIKVKVTAEDSLKATRFLREVQNQLARQLEDDSIRDQWRLAIEGETLKLQDELAKEAEKISPTIKKIGLYLGLSMYLGDSGEYDYPPRVINPDPIESLNSMISAPAWKRVSKIGNITKM